MTTTQPDFRIQAGALRSLVHMARPIATGRKTIPILAHLLLRATAGAAFVEATDLERYLTVQGAGDGDLAPITVDAVRLCALLDRLPAEATVTLAPETTGQLRLVCGDVTARLFTLPAEDWPKPWELGEGAKATFTMQAGDLHNLFDRPSHAISTEETRYYLNGIYLHRDDAGLRAVATDGHRMFMASAAWPAEGSGEPNMIIPHRAIRTALDLLRRMAPEQAVTLEMEGTKGVLIGRTWTLRFKAIDGTFPNYRAVVPKTDAAWECLVQSGKQLSACIGTARAIMTERSAPLRISNGSGNQVTLSAASAHDGDCTVAVPAEVATWATDAEHPTVGVQARYLNDLCRVFPREFTMRVLDGHTPIHIEGPEGLAVLMPMRI